MADPRLVFAAIAIAGLIQTAWVLSTFAAEANRDWWVFAAGGARIAGGESPYDPGPFIYPPGMALLWSGPMTDSIWALLKLGTLALFVPMLGWTLGAAVLALTVLQPPLQYDFLMGNVTVFYVAAIIWFRRRHGWSGAIPLGIVLALAVKPLILPLLVVETRWRVKDVARVAAISVAVAAATLPVVGVTPYVEYAGSLLAWAGASAVWVDGNLGPGRYGLGGPALVIGIVVVLLAFVADSEERAVVLALGASVLIQPAYGFYYAALLIPAALELWRVDRIAALWASLLGTPLAFVSPALSGIAFVVAAIPWGQLRTRRGARLTPGGGG